jgi:hypothetical protein
MEFISAVNFDSLAFLPIREGSRSSKEFSLSTVFLKSDCSALAEVGRSSAAQESVNCLAKT